MSFLRRLWGDVRGNVLVLTAFGMPIFIGAAGLATDTILWAMWKRELQRAADSASLAGALTVQQAKYQAEKAARHDFKKSKAFSSLKAQMWFENAPHQGPWKGDDNAVKVTVRLKTSLPFSEFFLKSPLFIQAGATATLAAGRENCLISLDRSASASILFDGSTDLTMSCNGFANSNSNSAITATGAAMVVAPYLGAVGKVVRSSHLGATQLQDFQPPQFDPFKDGPKPRVPSPCGAPVLVEPKQIKYLGPGCYSGMTLKGRVNLSPGIYYVTTADLHIGSQAIVSGSGVTFVLTASPGTSMYPQFIADGGADINLSAPDAGDYKNLLVYQDPSAPFFEDRLNRVTGGSAAKLSGAMYFPNQKVKFDGNSSMDLSCFKLVARQIHFTGGANFANQCSAKDERFSTRRVRLVS